MSDLDQTGCAEVDESSNLAARPTSSPVTPVYLDEAGHLWSPDRERLHAVAAAIGLQRSWFQERPRLYHYDIMSQAKRARARRIGVIGVSSRELIRLIQAADGPQAD